MNRCRAAAMRGARVRGAASRLFGVLLAGCLCSGCSYSFSRSSLPPYIHTIAIPVLKNSTSEPGLQDEMTDAISRQFIADSSLRVVPESEADSGIYGVITDYRNQVFGYNASEQTEEYEVLIAVSVEYKDLVKRKTRWNEERLVGRTTYFVVETSGQEAQTELTARAEAFDRLAEDILNRTVRNWN